MFIFDNTSVGNVDVLTDFLGGDQLVLDPTHFTALNFDGSGRLLLSDLFYGSIADYDASDSTANLIFDFSSGALYYDANGRSGFGATSDAIQVLQITSGADLSNTQIYNALF